MMSPRLHLFLPLYSLSLYVFTFFSFAAARHVFKRALQTEAWIVFIVDLIWGCSLGTWRQIRQKRKNWLLLSTQLCEQWTPFLISPSSILQLQSSSVIMQLCVMLLALHISSPYVSPRDLSHTSCLGPDRQGSQLQQVGLIYAASESLKLMLWVACISDKKTVFWFSPFSVEIMASSF